MEKAEACFGTPIERLLKMNAPAVELYRSKGLNIAEEYLEIALCAQHNNGGIAVDLWWQTSVKGLFAAGECAGTHGVTRPGGSALNAGQVGSLRAAQYIAEHGNEVIGEAEFAKVLEKALLCIPKAGTEETGQTMERVKETAKRRMSDAAAAIRSKAAMEQALEACRAEQQALANRKEMPAGSRYQYYKLRDILVTQEAVLTAMIHYGDTVGATRGSSLCYDEKGTLREGLEELFRFTEEAGDSRSQIQEVVRREHGFEAAWRTVRSLPEEEDFFENIWRDYRIHKNIY